MNFKLTQNPGLFLESARPLLEQEEAANNLTIGLTLALKDKFGEGPIPLDKALMVLIEEGGVLIGTLMQTPPRDVILYLAKDWRKEAVQSVAKWLKEREGRVSGIMSEAQVAEAFALAYAGPGNFKVRYSQSAWELRTVVRPRPSTGKFRLAKEVDRAVLEQYILGFQKEALYGEEGKIDPGALFDFWTARKALYVWEDGEAVSMAVSNRQTWNGASVGYVYTPPELRGKGYASNLVADLSQAVLDRGKNLVSLFTDNGNPTSNKIYKSVGYEPVMSLNTFVFT